MKPYLKAFLYWSVMLIIVLTVLVSLGGCAQTYVGTIFEYDGEGQLVKKWRVESNQPMLLEAGEIKGDSRTKPLFESLGMDLGFYKYRGDPGGWHEY